MRVYDAPCHLSSLQHVLLLIQKVHVEMFCDVHAIFWVIVSQYFDQNFIVFFFGHQCSSVPWNMFKIYNRASTFIYPCHTTAFYQKLSGRRVTLPLESLSFIQLIFTKLTQSFNFQSIFFIVIISLYNLFYLEWMRVNLSFPRLLPFIAIFLKSR